MNSRVARRARSMQPLEDAHPSAAVHVRVGLVPLIMASTGGGLFLIGLADDQARRDTSLTLPLFWLGVLFIVGPTIWRLLAPEPSRNERLCVTVILGLSLYAVKIMVNPIAFALPDEFTHLRTLQDILTTGHLFADNPLLRISPVYPGMEAATAVAAVTTGLGSFPLAMLLIGIARVVTMLSLFLVASTVTGSGRVAGIASVVYAANASFLPFDVAYSYESLALPLAFLVVWAVLGWLRHGGRGGLHAGIALAGIAATTVTHHLTSLVLVALLTTWAVVSVVRKRDSAPRWPIVVAAAWAIAVNAAWLLSVGGLAITYLDIIVSGGLDELAAVLTGTAPPKRLFVPRAGISAPLPEIIVAYSAVVLLLLALPFMLHHAIRGRRPQPFVIVLCLAALLYPASLALRFTNAGSETSQRASEFLFLSLGLLGADWLVGSRSSRWRVRSRPLIAACLLTVFAGGLVAGDPPQGRLPGPYHVGAEQRSIEPQGIDTATWALRELGPNNRLIADRTNAKLLGSIGAQDPVTSANEHFGTAYVMFAPRIGPDELDLLRRAQIRYVVVDFRLARDPPIYKYYFESAEPDGGNHTTPMPLASLQKFDGLPGVARIYDSGDIVIYDIRGLVIGPVTVGAIP
jgi:hypothetical protein